MKQMWQIGIKFKVHMSKLNVFLWVSVKYLVGCKGTKKRREWEAGKNKRNDLEKLNCLGLQMNSLIFFLKAAVMKMKAMLFRI